MTSWTFPGTPFHAPDTASKAQKTIRARKLLRKRREREIYNCNQTVAENTILNFQNSYLQSCQKMGKRRKLRKRSSLLRNLEENYEKMFGMEATENMTDLTLTVSNRSRGLNSSSKRKRSVEDDSLVLIGKASRLKLDEEASGSSENTSSEFERKLEEDLEEKLLDAAVVETRRKLQDTFSGEANFCDLRQRICRKKLSVLSSGNFKEQITV